MGVFDDKKFGELDWLSQATEPIESKLNMILAELPEEFDVDYATVIKIMGTSHFRSNICRSDIVYFLLGRIPTSLNDISYQENGMLMESFELRAEPNTIIDFEAQKMEGKITLVKTKNTFEDKDLEKVLGLLGMDKLHMMNVSDSGKISRANEIMELLGSCDDAIKSRSHRNKKRAIYHRIESIMRSNEWKIKDSDLANKVGFWIYDYVNDGMLASFSNFCRLKVMTHKGLPIYSMEEVT